MKKILFTLLALVLILTLSVTASAESPKVEKVNAQEVTISADLSSVILVEGQTVKIPLQVIPKSGGTVSPDAVYEGDGGTLEVTPQHGLQGNDKHTIHGVSGNYDNHRFNIRPFSRNYSLSRT